MQRLRSTLMLLISMLFLGTTTVGSAATPAAPTVPSAAVPESPDFAGEVLRDSWDMSEFSDISRDLNGLSTVYALRNPTVSGGVFSATTNTASAFLTLLYAGQAPDTLNVLRDGPLNPIDPARYKCLYVAMKVDTTNNASGRIFFFNDSRQQLGDHWGGGFFQLHPGADPKVANWKLYRLRLDQLSLFPDAKNSWTNFNQWNSLRIDPVLESDRNFGIDWTRLTTCAATTRTITWTPDPAVTAIWLQPTGTTRAIRVAPTAELSGLGTAVNGSAGSYDLDTQGLAAGSYQVGTGTLSSPPSSWSSTPLVINAAPIMTFSSPSAYSGDDFASVNGNPWDFDSATDAPLVRSQAVPGAATYRFTNEGLEVTSPSGPQPAGIDTQVYLNTPSRIDAREYRYISFRIKNTWTTKNFGPTVWPSGGMLVRLNWSVPSLTGIVGRECTYGGDDIPMDIGWRTYTFDLFDARNGKPDGNPVPGQPDCPANGSTVPWSSHSQITRFRLDPNENISALDDPVTGGGTFVQTLNWVRLTKAPAVNAGSIYTIKLALNKPSSDVPTRNFYYTTDRNNPTQNVAVGVPAPQPGNGSRRIYLPWARSLNGSEFDDGASNPLSFRWNTAGVVPGTYYVCATLNDGVNQTTSCSAIPLTVR